MSLRWRRLHLLRQKGLPPLLFRYSTTANGYELYLTDLTNIWTEHLNRRDILKRADEEGTTIDPSEDVEQFKVLLEKIGEALENKPGATVSLIPGLRVDSLELRVSAKLPAPLRPLTWTISLIKESASSTSQHLLLPLLRAEAAWELRQQTLLDQLSRKDWALSKLFDNIENMGMDLGTIFPSATGQRRARGETLLSQAARYIQGVAPFDEAEWLSEVAKSSPESSLAASIVAELTRSGEPIPSGRLDIPPDRWWDKLTTIEPATATPPRREEAQESTRNKLPERDMMTETNIDTDTDDLDDNDGFERQETPPRLRKAKEPERFSPAATASTAVGTDDEATNPQHDATSEEELIRSQAPSQKPPAKKPRGLGLGLGVIGRKKPTRQKSPTPPPAHVTQEPDPSAAQTKRQNIDDDDTTDSDLDQPPPPEPKKLKGPGPGLGVVGGKKPTRQKSPTPPQAHISQEPEPEHPAAQTRRQDIDDDDTTDSDLDQQPSPEPNKLKGPGLGLDVIGGKNEEKTGPRGAGASRVQEPAPESPPPIPAQPLPKRTGKLGMIGGKARRHADAVSDAQTQSHIQTQIQARSVTPPRAESAGTEDRPGQGSGKKLTSPSVAPPVEPRQKETEQERADRKREELKRQLEAKSKAPVKKKRRF